MSDRGSEVRKVGLSQQTLTVSCHFLPSWPSEQVSGDRREREREKVREMEERVRCGLTEDCESSSMAFSNSSFSSLTLATAAAAETTEPYQTTTSTDCTVPCFNSSSRCPGEKRKWRHDTIYFAPL